MVQRRAVDWLHSTTYQPDYSPVILPSTLTLESATAFSETISSMCTIQGDTVLRANDHGEA